MKIPLTTEQRSAMCAGLSAYEWQRLVSWMRDPDRQEAMFAFTAGHCRDAARAFEAALNETDFQTQQTAKLDVLSSESALPES